MDTMDMVQARTPRNVKSQASGILDALGLNMSTYINMSLNQLIIHRGIPFSVALRPAPYTAEQQLAEVNASLDMEGMPLSAEEISELRMIKEGLLSTEEARQKIISEVING